MEFINEIDISLKLEDFETDYDKAFYLQNLLIDRATGKGASDEHYIAIRAYFMNKSELKPLIPKWVLQSRNLDEYWSFIKNTIERYEPRRQYIRKEFSDLLDCLENNTGELPYKHIIDDSINFLDSQYINDCWQKIIDRKNTDFEGAITSSRTLLESVLKSILDDIGETTNSAGDLNKLYKEVAYNLNLSPNNNNEQVFKQILGACSSLVNGLASLRNEYGDSHGKGQVVYKPEQRHTDLAANIACAMSLFLIQTYKNNKKQCDQP